MRVQYLNYVPIREAVVSNTEIGEALVYEEVVQTAHPAGAGFAGEFAQRPSVLTDAGKIADAEAAPTGAAKGKAFVGQGSENDCHHGVVFADGIVRFIDKHAGESTARISSVFYGQRNGSHLLASIIGIGRTPSGNGFSDCGSLLLHRSHGILRCIQCRLRRSRR